MAATMMVAADFRGIGGVTVRSIRATDPDSEAWIRRIMRDPHAAAKRATTKRTAVVRASRTARAVPMLTRAQRIERVLERCTSDQRDALIAACIAAY